MSKYFKPVARLAVVAAFVLAVYQHELWTAAVILIASIDVKVTIE